MDLRIPRLWSLPSALEKSLMGAGTEEKGSDILLSVSRSRDLDHENHTPQVSPIWPKSNSGFVSPTKDLKSRKTL